jgi:flagellar biosynthesis/type III secretory pathway chaperone
MIAQEGTFDRIYVKLESNLEEITKLYRQMVDLLRKEKEILIKAEIDKIEESNKQKELILARLKSLDALRVKYASDVAMQLSLDPAQPRLLEIARELGGVRADKLRSIHAALEILMKKIPELNKENEQYAQSALSHVKGAMDNVKGVLSGPTTYKREGSKEKSLEASGHLISREA